MPLLEGVREVGLVRMMTTYPERKGLRVFASVPVFSVPPGRRAEYHGESCLPGVLELIVICP